ncbi:gefF [Symbiodinium sp. CCMP2592]|nr:gefF [Symbiodinium sp. CCMP2592]
MLQFAVMIMLALQPARSEASAWRQLTPSGTAPYGRFDHNAVWANGTGMLIFGGYDGSYRNDLHLYTAVSNHWQQLTPSGTAPSVRSDHSAVWANGAGMLMLGGSAGGIRKNDGLHLYSADSNTWQHLTPSGVQPSARSGHAAVWANGLGMRRDHDYNISDFDPGIQYNQHAFVQYDQDTDVQHDQVQRDQDTDVQHDQVQRDQDTDVQHDQDTDVQHDQVQRDQDIDVHRHIVPTRKYECHAVLCHEPFCFHCLGACGTTCHCGVNDLATKPNVVE